MATGGHAEVALREEDIVESEVERNLSDHFEWPLAFDDEVDKVALAAGQLFDHVLCCGPDARIRAVDLCGQKQDEGGVGEVHGRLGILNSVSEAFLTTDASTL